MKSPGFDSTFGQRLGFALHKRGITQADAARMSFIAPSTISHFIRDKRKPSLDNLRSLVGYCHLDANYLLGFTSWNNKAELMQLRWIVNAIKQITKD